MCFGGLVLAWWLGCSPNSRYFGDGKAAQGLGFWPNDKPGAQAAVCGLCFYWTWFCKKNMFSLNVQLYLQCHLRIFFSSHSQ